MTNPFDYSNDKPDIREPIPAGTPLFLRMTYTPGGADHAGCPPEAREGALTASKEGDSKYLKSEFTVLRGPYKGRKFWGNLTVEGGKVDEKGKSIAAGITRKTIRLILDSSQGLKTSDESPEAMAKRVIRGYRDLQGRQFVAKAKVEPAQNGYPAKNGLGQVLTVDMKDYPTEAQLDDPPKPGTPAAAAPAPLPSWTPGAPAAQATPATTSPAVDTAPAFQVAPAPVPTAAPASNDSAIPAWAQSAKAA